MENHFLDSMDRTEAMRFLVKLLIAIMIIGGFFALVILIKGFLVVN